MDSVRASNISKELFGKHVGGWIIKRHINSGKSAVVLEGEKNGLKAAIKIFDPELVERFGKSTQLTRIKRECSLIGKSNPNLVKIFDGGECEITGYLFVSMELIDAPNLGDSLNKIPREKIAQIIRQISKAAKFLEEENLAHRDIKPENIAIADDYSRAVLLDLGVIRPFGEPGLTDEDARVFVGTLRYSSPEFLLRDEKDTLEGWRSLTFYQLGAVLHDMIMRQPLFFDFTDPYALLVEAVKNEIPQIHANDVSPELILLCQNCLVKSPEARLFLVDWDDFLVKTKINKPGNPKDRVRKRILLKRLDSDYHDSRQTETNEQLANRLLQHIDGIIRKECVGNGSCPRLEIITKFKEKIELKLIFDSSVPYSLPQKLCIHFNFKIIDLTNFTIVVNVSSYVYLKDNEIENPLYNIKLFSGALESEVLSERVQSIIWSCFDLAQQQKFVSDIDGILWIDLNSEVEI